MINSRLLRGGGILLGVFLFFNFQVVEAPADTCFFDGGITASTNNVNLSSQNTRVNFIIKVRTSTGTCDGFQIARDIFNVANNQETFVAHLGPQIVLAGSDRIDFYWDTRGYQPGTYFLRAAMSNITLDSPRISLEKGAPAGKTPDREITSRDQSNLPGYDLTIEGIGRIITAIACWTLSVILAVMVIALVIAGIRFYIGGAAGDVTKAKTNLLWVLVGIAVVLATNVIIATVAYYLGADYASYLPLKCGGVGTRFEGSICSPTSGCPNPNEVCVIGQGDTQGICQVP